MGNSPLHRLGQSSGLLPRSELSFLHAAARGDFEAVKQWHTSLIDHGAFSPNKPATRKSFSFRRNSSHKPSSVPTSPSASTPTSPTASSIDVNYHLPDGDFALMLAAAHGDVAFVEYLVEEMNCDVDNVDHHGCTTLMTAIQRNALPIVRYLCLDGQCDLTIMDENGRTAMHYAAMSQETSEILRFLCTLDANEQLVMAKDIGGNTPLLTLLLENKKVTSLSSLQQMAVALIDAGAEPSWCNLAGMDAWQAANQRDMKEQNMFEIAESGTAGILATAVRRRQRKRRQVVNQVLNVFELANIDSGVDESIKTDHAIEDVLDVVASYDNHQIVPDDLASTNGSPAMTPTPTHRSQQPSISQLSPVETPRSNNTQPSPTAIELTRQSNPFQSPVARALSVDLTAEDVGAIAELGSSRGLLSEDKVARTSSEASVASVTAP